MVDPFSRMPEASFSKTLTLRPLEKQPAFIPLDDLDHGPAASPVINVICSLGSEKLLSFT